MESNRATATQMYNGSFLAIPFLQEFDLTASVFIFSLPFLLLFIHWISENTIQFLAL